MAVLAGGLFYFRFAVYYSHGRLVGEKVFEIQKGEGSAEIATRLKAEGFITGKIYFYYYLRSHGLLNNILPGKYNLSGQMTIPEIAVTITHKENILPDYAKVTFPEGLTLKQMAAELEEKGLPGADFLAAAAEPELFRAQYDFFPADAQNLEGYLFPDTYYFSQGATGQGIVLKMLDNFGRKLTPELRAQIVAQKKTVSEIVTMASIIEKEATKTDDANAKLISGVFWNRIAIGQALQSDATLSYALGKPDAQHSGAELDFDSPYNSYKFKGLPPGPICNPGLNAIVAALNPAKTDYNFFLHNQTTGETFFARTFEEHLRNKAQNGL